MKAAVVFSVRGICTALFCMYSIASYGIVKISGTISNKASDSITISYNSNRLAYYPNEYHALLGKSGDFALQFPVPEGIYIQAEIKHGKHLTEVMLRDGDSLVLYADVARFDSSVRYAGNGADVQNFVMKHILARGRINQYTVRMKNSLELAPEAFVAAIQKEKTEEQAFVEKNKGKLPVSFLNFWMAHFTYYNYFFMQQYPQMHEAVKLKRFTDTIPDENYSVVKEIPLAFNDSLLQVPPYLLYLSGVFEAKLKSVQFAHPLSVPSNATLFLDSVNTLAYTSLPGKSAEYFIAQSLYARARSQPVERTRAEFSTFKNNWPRSEYLPLLQKQVGIAEKMAPGQPAPDIDIILQTGTKVKLSELKGKVVYLSFWSMQCRQCVGEMRGDKKVKEVFKNKPVEFVYVSIDEDSAAARKLITQLRIEGGFSWTTGGWYSSEAQQYGVQGMPAHFLIDREGNFAMQNPPGPAQKTELIVAISKLY